MAQGNHNNDIGISEFLEPMSPIRNYIAALGSYSPDPEKVNRYSLFLEKENKIEPLRDAWLSKEESKKLSSYPNVIIADSDAMYALGPNVVWYINNDFFKIYEECNLKIFADKHRVVLNKTEYKQEEIIGIHVYLNGWSEFGLRLVLKEEEVLVTRQFNEIASIDITYDGLNLLADTFWVCMLGRDLAKFLDKTCILDEDLQ